MCGAQYRALIQRYQPLSLTDERRLIAAAQQGSAPSTDELVLRHIGFVSFRLHTKIFPDLLRRFGEDLLAEAIPILYAKIQTYDLAYRDQTGRPKPVRFVSYIWKRIDGHILDSLQRELLCTHSLCEDELADLSVLHYNQQNIVKCSVTENTPQ